MSLRDKIIVILQDDGPRLPAVAVAQALHLPAPAVQRELERMEQAGLVSWVQEAPGTAWLWSLEV